MSTLEILFVRIVDCVILAPTKQSQEHSVWDIYPFKEGGYDVSTSAGIVEMMQDIANLQETQEERIVMVTV